MKIDKTNAEERQKTRQSRKEKTERQNKKTKLRWRKG